MTDRHTPAYDVSGARYNVEWWDHEADDWHRHRTNITHRTLRRVLRNLYSQGWGEMSLQVERIDEPSKPAEQLPLLWEAK